MCLPIWDSFCDHCCDDLEGVNWIEVSYFELGVRDFGTYEARLSPPVLDLRDGDDTLSSKICKDF